MWWHILTNDMICIYAFMHKGWCFTLNGSPPCIKMFLKSASCCIDSWYTFLKHPFDFLFMSELYLLQFVVGVTEKFLLVLVCIIEMLHMHFKFWLSRVTEIDNADSCVWSCPCSDIVTNSWGFENLRIFELDYLTCSFSICHFSKVYFPK